MNPLRAILRFDGKIGRLSYLVASLALYGAQLAAIWAIETLWGSQTTFDTLNVVAPIMTARTITGEAPRLAFAVVILLASWAFASVAFRRVSDADVQEWLALLVLIPFLHLPVIAALSLLPPGYGRTPEPPVDDPIAHDAWPAVAQGLISGAAIMVAAVALSALVFRAYGYGIFVASPLVVGLTTAYFANRRSDVGAGATVRLALGAAAIGGVVLMAVALEGAVCIVMASPIVAALTSLGALFGHAVAQRRHARSRTLTALAVLPIIFAIEGMQPPQSAFQAEQVTVIDAPARRVWTALIDPAPITEAPGLPFRMGIAYPIKGEIVQPGTGGSRRGSFSTGVAVEQITGWEVARQLTFRVLEDVPAMVELSPYAHVHAPHVIGYFRTIDTGFTLRPISDGKTELTLRTTHQLNLNPLFYWRPLAHLVVHLNNARVLRDIAAKSLR